MGGITYYVCAAVNRLPFVPAESETSGPQPDEEITIVEGS
jgi:hypothetical protein